MLSLLLALAIISTQDFQYEQTGMASVCGNLKDKNISPVFLWCQNGEEINGS